MKLNKIAALCGLAFAGFAGQALAVETHTQNALTANQVVFISGASAVKNSFGDIVSNLFETAASGAYDPVRYKDSANNFLAVVGKLKAGNGAWSGSDVALIYRTLGGSVFGIEPIAGTVLGSNGFAVDTLDLTAATTGGAGTAASPYVLPLTAQLKPDAGISDTDPKFFTAPYNTASVANVLSNGGDRGYESIPDDTPDLSNVVSSPLYLEAFGIAVTDNVPDTVVFTKAIVAGIYGGYITKWNQVDSSLPAEDIVICRRTPGSGSQTVTNAYFLGLVPQNGSALSPIDRYTGSAFDDSNGSGTTGTFKYLVNGASTGSPIVIENDGSGDVRTCLQSAISAASADVSYTQSDRTGNPTKNVTVTFKQKSGGYKAIGLLSTDSLGNAGGLASTTGWNFRGFGGIGRIAVQSTVSGGVTTQTVVTGSGGVADTSTTKVSTARFPTAANLLSGAWDYVSWETLNVPSYTTGAKLAVINAVRDTARTPSKLKVVGNTSSVNSFLPDTAIGIVWGNGAVQPTDTSTSGYDHVSKAVYLNGDQSLPYYRAY